jgi:hypothetical protein
MKVVDIMSGGYRGKDDCNSKAGREIGCKVVDGEMVEREKLVMCL